MSSDSAPNLLDKLPAIIKMNLDKNLCVCNKVPKIDIINAIVNGANTVAEVRKQTYTTMGEWLLYSTGRTFDRMSLFRRKKEVTL